MRKSKRLQREDINHIEQHNDSAHVAPNHIRPNYGLYQWQQNQLLHQPSFQRQFQRQQQLPQNQQDYEELLRKRQIYYQEQEKERQRRVVMTPPNSNIQHLQLYQQQQMRQNPQLFTHNMSINITPVAMANKNGEMEPSLLIQHNNFVLRPNTMMQTSRANLPIPSRTNMSNSVNVNYSSNVTNVAPPPENLIVIDPRTGRRILYGRVQQIPDNTAGKRNI